MSFFGLFVPAFPRQDKVIPTDEEFHHVPHRISQY